MRTICDGSQEKSTSMCSEVSKSQAVHLVDVFLLPPSHLHRLQGKGTDKSRTGGALHSWRSDSLLQREELSRNQKTDF